MIGIGIYEITLHVTLMFWKGMEYMIYRDGQSYGVVFLVKATPIFHFYSWAHSRFICRPQTAAANLFQFQEMHHKRFDSISTEGKS